MYKFLTLLLMLICWFNASTQIIKLPDDYEPPKHSGIQLELPVGDTPRIIVDSEASSIQVQFAGYNDAYVFHFQDSLFRYLDTLDEPAPELTLLVDGDLQDANWIEVRSLETLDSIDLADCVPMYDKRHELLLKQAFDIEDVSGFIVLAKGRLDVGSKSRLAYYYEPYLLTGINCEYINLCRANFWGVLEKMLITEIVYNGFPVILTIEETNRTGEGKNLRIIFNKEKTD